MIRYRFGSAQRSGANLPGAVWAKRQAAGATTAYPLLQNLRDDSIHLYSIIYEGRPLWSPGLPTPMSGVGWQAPVDAGSPTPISGYATRATTRVAPTAASSAPLI